MNNYILMLFEGKKTEPLIVDNLKKYYLNENDKTIVKAVYGTVIYKLYKEFFLEGDLDEDLDLFPIIKENIKNFDGEQLDNISREQVSEIFLFFDYDGHASNADDAKLQKMLELFNNETEKGKLFISYPMVESLKHLKNDINFKDVTIEIESSRRYKELVSLNCNYTLKNLSNLSKEDWAFIINEHCKKANFIMYNNYILPDTLIEQISIYTKQKENYISTENKVSVLSSFPLFLLDYYGVMIFEN